MTKKMWEQICFVAGQREPPISENEWMREAIRSHLDSESDLTGSRRHFQRSFQTTISELEQRITQQTHDTLDILLLYAQIQLHMTAFAMSQLIAALANRRIEPQQLIQKAIADAVQERESLTALISARLRDE
jgi:hypothetical protein